MKIRSLLAVLALCGSLALTACSQEAAKGGGGSNPYGSSAGSMGGSASGSAGGSASGSAGGSAMGGGGMQ